MCKKLVYMMSFVLALGIVLTSITEAGLVGHWRLDGSAADSSGNGLDGVIFGAPQWVDGKVGGAMETDGDDWVEVPGTSAADGFAGLDGEVTWAVWFKTSNAGVLSTVMALGPTGAAHVRGNRSINIEASGVIMIRAHSVGALTSLNSTAVVNDGEWHHVVVAMAFETDGTSDTMKVYIDGDLDKGYEVNTVNINQHSGDAADFIITLGARGSTPFVGLIDDARVYDHVLSEVEILSAMESKPWPYAFGPSPADGALHESTWINLSWMPGELAASHDVYLGDHFDDVNEATRDSEVFRGNQTANFYVAGFPGFAYPDGLVPGTTYCWRIDEVNDADPNSPWKGSVWSFTVPSKTAYDPNPADGGKFIDPEVTLSWTPGMGAIMHTVYFGDNFDEINNAAGGAPVPEITYNPGTLELDKTYYWRVDEFDGITTHQGDVWSFSTLPLIEMTDDPNLVGWWKLDEGTGKTAIDNSGYGHHGTIYGDPLWVDGYDLGALQFDGDDRVEMPGTSAADGFAALDGEVTWTAWFKTPGEDATQTLLALGPAGAAHVQGNRSVNVEPSGVIMIRGNSVDPLMDVSSTGTVNDDQWHHVAVTIAFESNGVNDGMKVYIDGDLGAGYEVDDIDINQYSNVAGDFIFTIGDRGGSPFIGLIDDVRIYDRVLTQDEIVMVMRIDPLLAWKPAPRNGSMPDIDSALPLSWSPGDNASQHDVYFGLDQDTLDAADSSDATGIYRGRQNGTTFTPSEGVEWGGGPYYWRIDEVNTDGTMTKGRIWSFTVADFILVDDFESYTDNDTDGQAIWQHWIDGFGVPDNGAQVGYLLPPYAEQTLVNSGNQSMPLLYDNTAGVTNSEAVLTLTAPRDWTRHGLTDLSLWFRGYPGSVGSFAEAPAGTFTLTGAGTDIWDTADEFHYAFKTLTGPGSIVARVNSIENTNAWAKAGVMIRETLDAGSKHVLACVSPENGVAFQRRTTADAASTNTNETGITAPHWVKIERDMMGNFTVMHSTNGTAWQSVADAIPITVSMASNVYIGLALTSHDATATTQAVFSNVTMTGNVSGQWAHQDIGITSNAAEPMYVALSNQNGAPAVVANEDPAAATIDVWTEWRIPLQAFTDQGINLTNVDKIAIGLGSKGGAAVGGSGTIYIDDIRLNQ